MERDTVAIQNSTSDAELVLPKSGGLRQLIHSELQSAPLAELFGDIKTLAALLKRVWWPGMAREVVFCKACDVY